MAEFKQKFDKTWISEKLNTKAVNYAEDLGRYLQEEKFSTSQIRNIYGEVKRIEQKGIGNSDSFSSFLLLKPKLAYAAKRTDKQSANVFKNELNQAIDVVLEDSSNQEARFKNFCQLFEAVLAYHKAFGGK